MCTGDNVESNHDMHRENGQNCVNIGDNSTSQMDFDPVFCHQILERNKFRETASEAC